MKKLSLTLAIVLGLGMTTFAIPNEGGIFQRGTMPDQKNGIFGSRNSTNSTLPLLPQHLQVDDEDADETPLGAGIAVLSLLGGAYLVAKKRREE